MTELPPAASARAARAQLIGFGALGLLGYFGMVLTGTRLGPLPDPPRGMWWFSLPSGHLGTFRVLFYLCAAMVVGGWLGVGLLAQRKRLGVRAAVLLTGVWSSPLLIGPPIFSKDLYSYIGQGLVAHAGFDTYTRAPAVLGNGPLLESIASVWRHTPAPYGPLFVEIARAASSSVQGSIVSQVLVMRATEVAGMALLVVFLPRLAACLGADRPLSLWLGVMCPLVLLSFMASGHNDCLMLGLLVAGVALHMEGRRLQGLVVCSLAALIKAPAAAAIVFLAVDELRRPRYALRKWVVVLEAAGIAIGCAVVVTVASGLGWGWLRPSNLMTAADLRIDATPSVSVGLAFSRVLHTPAAGTITTVQSIAGLFVAVGFVWLVFRFRHANLVRMLAIALALVVLAGPTLWPWYLTWALVLLAATSAQRSRVLGFVGALAMFLAGPVGTPQLSGYSYWPVALATLGACVWLATGGRWRTVMLEPKAS
ncbi:MAG: polyprenol phosphomannose-dependent alpha 1,6 mannosyltransferase MptB [Acidimicrobiales bacterium]